VQQRQQARHCVTHCCAACGHPANSIVDPCCLWLLLLQTPSSTTCSSCSTGKHRLPPLALVAPTHRLTRIHTFDRRSSQILSTVSSLLKPLLPPAPLGMVSKIVAMPSCTCRVLNVRSALGCRP
jgi:hypothetical protein